MTELYKSRHYQAIHGVNRNDDSINFIHGENCFSHFGDGLGHPEKLTVDTALAQKQGRDKKVGCESLNKIAESGIGDAFRARESKLKQWREHLNKEIDKLGQEIENVNDCQKDLLKKQQYFSNMLRASEATSNFREKMEDHDSNDKVENLLREEHEKILKANKDMKQYYEELKESEKKLKKARNALMSEVEAKSLTINIGKRCQHAEPLLSFPYIPADHPVDQLYHPNSEDDWERNLADKVQNAVFMRQEADRHCEKAAASIRQNKGDTAGAWFRTSKALQEMVQEEEKSGQNIRNFLKRINQDIASANQRVAYFFSDLKVQDRVKNTQLWRLQTMTYRPGHDNIQDIPVRKLDEEVKNIERKTAYITDNLNHNKELLYKLNEEKIQQTLELEQVARKLFIARENCLGIRRSLKIEGVNLDDYISP